jgi:hypothetical protein
MIRRVVELALIVAVIAGGVLAIRSGREHSQLRAEHQRLARAVGEITSEDPGKVALVALETGDPMHFA